MQDPYSSHPPSSAPRKRQRLALIVEHHIWLRLTLTSLFEEIGFAVTTASNGYAGLRRAIDLRPNVVVLGNALPELSSAQVADELRNLRDPSGMQVILTSSLLGADERNRREKSLRARSARPWSGSRPAEQPRIKRSDIDRLRVRAQYGFEVAATSATLPAICPSRLSIAR